MNLIGIFIDAHEGNSSKKLISKIYSTLQMDKGLSTMNIKSRWEKEANIQLNEEDWFNICGTSSTTSSSDQWREFRWKNVRFFITPKIKSLQTKNPDHPRCWRACSNGSAGQFHIFWDCPNISSYWEETIAAIKSILNIELDLSFSVTYLGNLPNELNKSDRYLLQLLLVSSKKALTMKWLSNECPTIHDWIDIVEEIHSMERLFSLRHDTERGIKYWEKWRCYLSQR